MTDGRESPRATVPRALSPREFAHERLGAAFEEAVLRAPYDTQRRLETLVDEFLPARLIAGRSVLDAGCGPGFFTERLAGCGAVVTACDIGPDLVARTAARAACTAVVADVLSLTTSFGRDRFDVVLSSECVEHTPDPDAAIEQLVAVVKPGGYISLSTPNIVWAPVVKLATATRLRPYDGFENFSSWWRVRGALARAGAAIVEQRGLHLFPFQIPAHRLSRWCDRRLQPLRGLMINICVLARKGAV